MGLVRLDKPHLHIYEQNQNLELFALLFSQVKLTLYIVVN